MIITDNGTVIRIPVAQVSTMGRYSRCKIISLRDEQFELRCHS